MKKTNNKFTPRGPRITMVRLEDLKPNPRNARKHPPDQIKKIAKSIKTFGFLGPVLIDENNVLIAGHGRAEAAKRAGLESVPAVRVEHLTKEQKDAYTVTDNRLAELAIWDRKTLERELSALNELDLKFDIEVTGFDLEDFDLSVDTPAEQEAKKEVKDEKLKGAKPKTRGKPKSAAQSGAKAEPDGGVFTPVSSLSDVWRLGNHRLTGGNVCHGDNVCRAFLGQERPQLGVTRAPVDVGLVKANDYGFEQHLFFNENPIERRELLERLVHGFCQQAAFCKTGAPQVVFMPANLMDEMEQIFRACLWEVEAIVPWGSHILYAASHHAQSSQAFDLHLPQDAEDVPALIETAIQQTTKAGDLVLDVLGGSDLILAAEKTGRCARVIEGSARAMDRTILEWEKMTGETAVLEATGQSFADVAQERANAPYRPSEVSILDEQIKKKGTVLWSTIR